MPEPDSPTYTDDAKKLSDADQARVDAFLEQGGNSVERKPFKPLLFNLFVDGSGGGFQPVEPRYRSVGRYLLISPPILDGIGGFGILRASVCGAAW